MDEAGTTGIGLGAAAAVRPSTRLSRGTGGSDAAGAGALSAEAAVLSVSGMLGGAAANCCTMSRHGTPGLGVVSAAAVKFSTRTGHINPAVAKEVTARRFVVRDMLFQDLSDSAATK
jgi:hypothetical protein